MTDKPNLRVVESGEPETQEQKKKKKKKKKTAGVEARWPGRLGVESGFVPVSSFFLANYHRIPHEGGGLNSAEAMLIIQILDHKWDHRAPFPSLGTLAERMGISKRQVRNIIKSLEDLGLVKRVQTTKWSANRFHFDGLYEVLERLMDEQIAEADEADVEGGE